MLLPAQMDLLPFSRPKQSFERFGPVDLDWEKDICHDLVLAVIENDKDYCRVDTLQSLDELKAVL